jgi:hypothetical protein
MFLSFFIWFIENYLKVASIIQENGDYNIIFVVVLQLHGTQNHTKLNYTKVITFKLLKIFKARVKKVILF